MILAARRFPLRLLPSGPDLVRKPRIQEIPSKKIDYLGFATFSEFLYLRESQRKLQSRDYTIARD